MKVKTHIGVQAQRPDRVPVEVRSSNGPGASDSGERLTLRPSSMRRALSELFDAARPYLGDAAARERRLFGEDQRSFEALSRAIVSAEAALRFDFDRASFVEGWVACCSGSENAVEEAEEAWLLSLGAEGAA